MPVINYPVWSTARKTRTVNNVGVSVQKRPQELGYLRLAEQKGLGSIASYSRKEITL